MSHGAEHFDDDAFNEDDEELEEYDHVIDEYDGDSVDNKLGNDDRNKTVGGFQVWIST